MKTTFKTWFYRLFRIKYCKQCASTHLNTHGSWNGAWNNWLQQASARHGTRCFDCGNFVWTKTQEAYEKGLPKWCTAYKEIIKPNIYK